MRIGVDSHGDMYFLHVVHTVLMYLSQSPSYSVKLLFLSWDQYIYGPKTLSRRKCRDDLDNNQFVSICTFNLYISIFLSYNILYLF